MENNTNDPFWRHLFDEDSVFNVYKNDSINLSIGAPGPDLLQHCIDMFKRATDHRLKQEEKEGMYYLFQYGITAGLWECREELSKFLTRRYGDSVKRENLILTCGASHALHLLIDTVISPNGVIFVEEVTYMSALDLFKQFPLMKIITVPMKNDSVDVDAFEKIVIEQKRNRDYLINEQKIFWSMLYTIPTFHNPTGSTLPPDRCKRLVTIARQNSMLIVCDDVYNLLYYGKGYPPQRLFSYDDPIDDDYKGGNIVSIGTFSKICTPAIRFGWIEGSPRISTILSLSGIMWSGGAVNHYVSGLVTSLLELGIEDDYLNKLIQVYGERLSVLCNILDHYLPKFCSFQRPDGGYFVWIRLPHDMNGSDFINWCQKKYKISAVPGAAFSYSGNYSNALRLSIGFYRKDVIKSAVKTLCDALLNYYNENAE